MDSPQQRIDYALTIAEQFGNVDGEQHKQWCIDKMVRALTGTDERYERWLYRRNADIDENGQLVPDVFEWDTGVAPEEECI